MKKIGIIGAMEVEVALLKNLIAQDEFSTVFLCGMEFFKGKIDDTDVVVVKSGVGKVNAALCAQLLVVKFGVTHIINTGIAGAMESSLHVFDFVISSDAVYHDMDATGFGYEATQIPQMKTSTFLADKKMVLAVQQSFEQIEEVKGHKILCGRIATGDQFIADKKVKEHIKAICSPACVEMEGAAIAHAAFLNNTPFVIIRCMSDEADDNNESVYNFNETTAAELSAKLVLSVISKI